MFDGFVQPTHLLGTLVVAMLVFGQKKPGEIGTQLGKNFREFKKSLQDLDMPGTPAEAEKTDSENISGGIQIS